MMWSIQIQEIEIFFQVASFIFSYEVEKLVKLVSSMLDGLKLETS